MLIFGSLVLLKVELLSAVCVYLCMCACVCAVEQLLRVSSLHPSLH